MREGRGEQRKIGCVGECVCPCGRDSPRRRESVKKGSTRVWMASGLSEEGGAGRDASCPHDGSKIGKATGRANQRSDNHALNWVAYGKGFRHGGMHGARHFVARSVGHAEVEDRAEKKRDVNGMEYVERERTHVELRLVSSSARRTTAWTSSGKRDTFPRTLRRMPYCSRRSLQRE